MVCISNRNGLPLLFYFYFHPPFKSFFSSLLVWHFHSQWHTCCQQLFIWSVHILKEHSGIHLTVFLICFSPNCTFFSFTSLGSFRNGDSSAVFSILFFILFINLFCKEHLHSNISCILHDLSPNGDLQWWEWEGKWTADFVDEHFQGGMLVDESICAGFY